MKYEVSLLHALHNMYKCSNVGLNTPDVCRRLGRCCPGAQVRHSTTTTSSEAKPEEPAKVGGGAVLY